MKHYSLFLDLEISKELHPFEKRLNEALRSIGSGEVASIKIQDGLPVIFQLSQKHEDLFSGISQKHIVDNF